MPSRGTILIAYLYIYFYICNLFYNISKFSQILIMSDFSSFYEDQKFESVNISVDQLEQSILQVAQPEVNLNRNELSSFINQSQQSSFRSFLQQPNSFEKIKPSDKSSLFIQEPSLPQIQQKPQKLPQNKSNNTRYTALFKPSTDKSFEFQKNLQRPIQKLNVNLDQSQFIQVEDQPAQKIHTNKSKYQIRKQPNIKQSQLSQSEAIYNIEVYQKKKNQNNKPFIEKISQQQLQYDNSQSYVYKDASQLQSFQDKPAKPTLNKKIPSAIAFFPCPNFSKYFPIEIEEQDKTQPLIKLGNIQNTESQSSLDQISSNDSWQQINKRSKRKKQFVGKKLNLSNEINKKDIQNQYKKIRHPDSFQSNKYDRFQLSEGSFELQRDFQVSNLQDLESQLKQSKKVKQPNSKKNLVKQNNTNHQFTQTDSITPYTKTNYPHKKSDFTIIVQIWQKMYSFCDNEIPIPRQLFSLNETLSKAWNLLLSICRMISQRLIHFQNFSYFENAIKQIQIFFTNPPQPKQAAKLGLDRIYNTIIFILFKLSRQNFAPSNLHRAIQELGNYFLSRQKFFVPFIKSILPFFLKKYLQFAYESSSQNNKKSINIINIFKCVDLLFKHSINPEIDCFLYIKSRNEPATMDQEKKKEIKLLIQLLEQISRHRVFFCRIFEQKSFPWLGIFTEHILRMKKKLYK